MDSCISQTLDASPAEPGGLPDWASEAKIVEKRSGRQAVNVARQMAIYCSQQLGDHSLKEIALHYNLTNAGSVSPAIAAIKSRMRNRELRREYSKVERLLGITK